MTENQKAQICALRKQGAGYMKIAQQTGLSQNTIKFFYRRNSPNEEHIKWDLKYGIGLNSLDFCKRV